MNANPMEAKKPYTPPTLIVHGTLEEITQGGVVNNINGPNGTAGSHVNPPASR